MWKRKKKHKGGRLDVLYNLLWGHPEWNLSGPVCQITSSFDGFVPGFKMTNKLNLNVLFCYLASLVQVIENNVNYKRWRCFPPVQLLAAAYFYRVFFGESSFFLNTPPPPSCRGQGWFPVILAVSVNACCSISTSIKLFFSCSAVTESTARKCRLRGLTINHTDSVRLCACVCACVLEGLCARSFFFASHPRMWRTFILPPWTRKCQRPL